MNTELALLILVWLAYFIIHSVTASLSLKRWVAAHRPGWMPAYRLAFNLLATLLLIPPLWLTLNWNGPNLWQWQGVAAWISNGLTLLALIGFWWSTKYYDGSEFIGVRQLRLKIQAVEDQEQFHISPLHRFVRHPWYFLGLLLIWTRNMDAAMLTSSIAMTLYFIIGSYFEERKLVAYHGERYRHYQQRVPALIPLPWKVLSTQAAKELVDP